MERAASAIVFLMFTLGCPAGCAQKSSVSLAPVSGMVTLDGKPLPNVMVSFHPDTGERAGYGMTDATGRYEIRYTGTKMGAPVGHHLVRIESGILQNIGDTEPEKPTPTEEPVYLPPQYNEESQLTADVRRGPNTFDFSLKSEGEKRPKPAPTRFEGS